MILKEGIASSPIISSLPSLGWQVHGIIRSDGHPGSHGRYESAGVNRKIPIRAYAELLCNLAGLGQPIRFGLHGAAIQTGHRNHCADKKDWYHRHQMLAQDFVGAIRVLLNKGPFSQHQPAQNHDVASQVSDKVFSRKILLRMGRMVNPRELRKSSEEK